jgi:hypothetical protein
LLNHCQNLKKERINHQRCHRRYLSIIGFLADYFAIDKYHLGMDSQIQDPSQQHKNGVDIRGDNNPSESDLNWRKIWITSKDGDPRGVDKRRWKTFWLNSQVLLGSFPLEEFDQYSPLLAKATAPIVAWTTLLKDVGKIVYFARHGGPNLNYLRGVCASIHHRSRLMLTNGLALRVDGCSEPRSKIPSFDTT